MPLNNMVVKQHASEVQESLGELFRVDGETTSGTKTIVSNGRQPILVNCRWMLFATCLGLATIFGHVVWICGSIILRYQLKAHEPDA